MQTAIKRVKEILFIYAPPQGLRCFLLIRRLSRLLAVSVPRDFDWRGFDAGPLKQLLRKPRRIEILGQAKLAHFQSKIAYYRCFMIAQGSSPRDSAVFADHGGISMPRHIRARFANGVFYQSSFQVNRLPGWRFQLHPGRVLKYPRDFLKDFPSTFAGGPRRFQLVKPDQHGDVQWAFYFVANGESALAGGYSCPFRAARYPLALASASLMNSPCFVFPYHRVPE